MRLGQLTKRQSIIENSVITEERDFAQQVVAAVIRDLIASGHGPDDFAKILPKTAEVLGSRNFDIARGYRSLGFNPDENEHAVPDSVLQTRVHGATLIDLLHDCCSRGLGSSRRIIYGFPDVGKILNVDQLRVLMKKANLPDRTREEHPKERKAKDFLWLAKCGSRVSKPIAETIRDFKSRRLELDRWIKLFPDAVKMLADHHLTPQQAFELSGDLRDGQP